MKILIIDIASFGNEDIVDAFRHLTDDGTCESVEIALFPYENNGDRRNAEFEERFAGVIRKETPDFVFSFNYFPIISTVCEAEGVRYVSWVYDSPLVNLYSYTLINKCNAVFLFDSQMYDTFASQGIPTVHYLPMAVPARRLLQMEPSPEQREQFRCDVSFVGSMYTEEFNLYERMEPHLDPYLKGYLDGIMTAQRQVDGVNFIESCLTGDIVDRLMKEYPVPTNPDGVETHAYMYAQYIINRKITGLERAEILKTAAAHFPLTLYTRDEKFTAPGIDNRGFVNYYTEMPYVFALSKVNLNITLRSIQKGIPLRCFDILGCGGFLVTNYQEDFNRFFVPGEDYVYYEDRKDLVNKIGWYLREDDRRQAIAESGRRKVLQDHTFDVRVRQILQVLRDA